MNKQAEDYFFTWFDNFEKRLRVIGERLDDHDKKLAEINKCLQEAPKEAHANLNKIKKWIEERK